MKKIQVYQSSLYEWIFPIIILLSFLLEFHPLLNKLFIRWDSDDNSYCYLIIPIFFYLLWKRKDQFNFSVFSWSHWGLIPILISVLMMITGELGSVETLLYIGIWGCLAGLIFMFYGKRSEILTFPMIILFFIVPLPPFIKGFFTFKLKMAAKTLSVVMLRGIGFPVFQEGNIIDLGIDKLQMIDACSGLRYFMTLALIALLIGYFLNESRWMRIILVVMVLPLSIFVNAVRVFITGLLVVNGYCEFTQDFSHDFYGLLIFMAAGFFLTAMALLLKKIRPALVQPPITNSVYKVGKGKTGLILSIIVSVVFLTGGWYIEQAPSSRNHPDRSAFASFPSVIGDWKGKETPLREEILNVLRADDYLNATYHRENKPNPIHLLISFYEYQGTHHTAHAPQSRQLGGGWEIIKSEKRVIEVDSQAPVKIMTMLMSKGNTRFLTVYFFYQRGRVIISPWMNKYYLIRDAFASGRTDGALVRAEMPLIPEQSVDEAYGLMEEFLKKIWKILPVYIPE